jgi:hypothetical protein
MSRPDFGMNYKHLDDGVQVGARLITPQHTLHDLVMIFERAKNEANPGDELAGDPSQWPEVRGVRAVADAILDAIYGN